MSGSRTLRFTNQAAKRIANVRFTNQAAKRIANVRFTNQAAKGIGNICFELKQEERYKRIELLPNAERGGKRKG